MRWITAGALTAAALATTAAPSPGGQQSKEARDTAKFVAHLSIFRRPMRHPRDEILPVGRSATAVEAAIAAGRNSRLIADTPTIRVWAVLEHGRLRTVSANTAPGPLLGYTFDEPRAKLTWKQFAKTGTASAGYGTETYAVNVLLLPDGSRDGLMVERDGTRTPLAIRRNAMVAQTKLSYQASWTDARGTRHKTGWGGLCPDQGPGRPAKCAP
jgi:hypothetical protein